MRKSSPALSKPRQRSSLSVFDANARTSSALSSPAVQSAMQNTNEAKDKLIIDLRRSRQLSKSIVRKSSQSMELCSNCDSRRVSVIDFSGVVADTAPKPRSSFPGRITLSNVQKYYQLCVKNAGNGQVVDKNAHTRSSSAKPEEPANKKQQPNFESFITHQSIRVIHQQQPDNIYKRANSIDFRVGCTNISPHGYKGMRERALGHGLLGQQIQFKQVVKARNAYSALSKKSPGMRKNLARYENAKLIRPKAREQFELGAWESAENVGDDNIF